MVIEFSETLATTIFTASASFMGICIAILAILAGFLRGSRRIRRKISERAVLEIDIPRIFSRLKSSVGLYAASLLISLLWLLLIEFPLCQNEINSSPILHGFLWLLMFGSVISFLAAFIVLLSSISSISFRMLGD